MKITETRINGIENPLGFRYDSVVCSWKVADTQSQKQTEAAVEVSLSEDFSSILWRKAGADLNQAGVPIDGALCPRTTYYYRVRVVGDQGDAAVSEVGHFETGKMSEPWRAEWIADGNENRHPVLRKQFSVEKAVRKARLYVSGVGLFEAYANGEKLGDEYLTPYVTNYEKNIQVITFPVVLPVGENTLEIVLGKGWYMGVFGLELQKNNYGDRMAAIAELWVEYADGTTTYIGTDGSWECRGSDIEDSGIYDGEIYNHLLWEGRENEWKPVKVISAPEENEGTKNLVKSHLMDRLSLPVRVMEDVPVREIIHTPVGETVLDMGQNFAGFMKFRSTLPKGTRVVLDFGEILQEGNFYNKNYRDAKSQFVYVSNGAPETVRPHFTFFGFRYVRVTGWEGELKKEDFIGKVLYSAVQRTGFLHTGHEKLNRLYENTLWGLKSNFIDMPTDCPQRSERLGWTGDAQVFAPTASYHVDTRAFFHKFIKDLMDEQAFLDGGIPNYVPNIGHLKDVGSVWGDIGTFLPQTLYTYYGNLEEMAYCYPMMKGWVDYIDRQDAARGERQYLYNFGFHFGDWLALDGPTPTSFKGSTEDGYVASLYYFRSAQITGEMAGRLGKTEDREHYLSLAENIKKAILREFFTPSGRLAMDTQAACVIALKFGVYMDRERLVRQFVARLKKDCNQIKCGFVGAPLLCTVLAEAGQYELAYDFLLKEEFPSWLFCVNLGATTVWERWNSVGTDGVISDTGMNSLNHYAYGSVMEFVYAYAAGIRPLEPGFRRAIIAPHPDIRLGKLACSYNSVVGKYVSNWEICGDGRIKAHVEIPFPGEAEVELPGDPEGKRILGAGAYDFDYVPTTDYRKPYCPQTTLHRLAGDPAAVGILAKYAPAIAGIAQSGDPEMGSNSLEEISHKGFLPFDPAQLQLAIEELQNRIVPPAGGTPAEKPEKQVKYYLAIDIGASSGRHIVGWRGETGDLHTQEVYRFPNGVQENDGHLMWDMETLYAHVVEGIWAAFAKYPQIESLSIDTWGVDYVLLRGDEPVLPCYAYRDNRTEDAIREVHEILPFSELYRRTGIQFQPFNTIYQFYADRKAGRLDGVTGFLMVPEYLMWRLTGVKTHEYTNATTTGLVNAATGMYDEEILRRLDLPTEMFTGISQPGTVLGDLKSEIAKKVGGTCKVVLCATHDTASAVEGIPMEGNQPYISSGTWSLLGIKTQAPLTSAACEKANYSNEGGVGYNRLQKNIMGMWLVNSLKKEICPDTPFPQIDAAAHESSCDALVDANANEFLAPKSMKAAFDVATDGKLTTVGDYFRCAYRSLANSYRDALAELEANTGEHFDRLYIVGGGAKNQVLNHLTEEATGKEVCALPIEATALGNLKIQLEDN